MAQGTLVIGNGNVGVNASCDGISEPTSATAEKFFSGVSRAKGKDGNIVAVLLSKPRVSLSVTGYSTDAAGPSLGAGISVGGASGQITSVSIEKSNDDFSRFTAEGANIG